MLRAYYPPALIKWLQENVVEDVETYKEVGDVLVDDKYF
jgi:hypothetical protein